MNSIKESGPVTAISGMPGSLRRVLGLAFGDRLPLHVPRRIGTAALQRDDVVDDVTRPSVRVAGLRHELLPGLRAAGDPPVAVPRADCAIIRRMAVPASAVIEPAALPGTTIIPAGTLDDTSWLKPTMEIYCDDAQSWVQLAGTAMQRFPKMHHER